MQRYLYSTEVPYSCNFTPKLPCGCRIPRAKPGNCRTVSRVWCKIPLPHTWYIAHHLDRTQQFPPQERYQLTHFSNSPASRMRMPCGWHTCGGHHSSRAREYTVLYTVRECRYCTECQAIRSTSHCSLGASLVGPDRGERTEDGGGGERCLLANQSATWSASPWTASPASTEYGSCIQSPFRANRHVLYSVLYPQSSGMLRCEYQRCDRIFAVRCFSSRCPNCGAWLSHIASPALCEEDGVTSSHSPDRTARLVTLD
jgi:hypothetical protein